MVSGRYIFRQKPEVTVYEHYKSQVIQNIQRCADGYQKKQSRHHQEEPGQIVGSVGAVSTPEEPR